MIRDFFAVRHSCPGRCRRSHYSTERGSASSPFPPPEDRIKNGIRFSEFLWGVDKFSPECYTGIRERPAENRIHGGGAMLKKESLDAARAVYSIEKECIAEMLSLIHI